LRIFAPQWSNTIAAKARRKRSGRKRAPAITTARAVPKITGMVDAGSEKGLIAISHVRKFGDLFSEVILSIFSFDITYWTIQKDQVRSVSIINCRTAYRCRRLP